MKKLKVLHLASFTGNIGDNANHGGTRKLFKEGLSYELEYTPLEMREFYWHKRAFNNEFVRMVNSHDFLLVGGGNYFELWVDASPTGTSIVWPDAIVDAIKRPVVFWGLGCDVGQGAPERNIARFRGFLDKMIGQKDSFVSLRNDGSMGTFKKHVGSYGDRIIRVPDGGVFFEPGRWEHPEIRPNRKTIAINLAGDMLDLRFSKFSYNDFVKSFALFINQLLGKAPGHDIVFIPHVFRDVSVISEVVSSVVPDELRRTRISVAAYLTGDKGADCVFDLYRQCDLALAMRFHANVCSIGMGVPTIGLACYPQVSLLFEELGIKDQIVFVDDPGFVDPLLELSLSVIKAPSFYRDRQIAIKHNLLGLAGTAVKKLDVYLSKYF